MPDPRLPVAAAQTVTASVTLYGAKVPDVIRLVGILLNARSVGEIYLIDNTPRGRKGARISAMVASPRVHYLVPGRNVGFGRGHNIALKKSVSVSKYHLVANLDTHFESSAIDALAEYMDTHPGVGAVTPRIINSDGSLQELPRLLPRPLDVIGRRFFPKAKWAKRRSKQYELKTGDFSREMDVAFLSGSFMFLRCEALKQVGLFDKRFFLYGEDLDLSRRLAARYRTVYLPHISVTHEWQRSNHKTAVGTLRAARAMTSYFNKWGWTRDAERDAINARILAGASGSPALIEARSTTK
jgi:GT2 family glycosyltransferase